MSEEDLRTVLANLNAQTPSYEVRLDDDMARGIAGSASIAAELARSRQDALHRGDRVAHVIVNGQPTISAIVNRAQATTLLAAGAVWVGPAHYAP